MKEIESVITKPVHESLRILEKSAKGITIFSGDHVSNRMRLRRMRFMVGSFIADIMSDDKGKEKETH